MNSDQLQRAAELCREAAETIECQGSHRLRVLMQMILLELAKERALLTRVGNGHDWHDPGRARRPEPDAGR